MNSRTRPVPVVPTVRAVRVGPLPLESAFRPRAASNPAPPAESSESEELTCLVLFLALKLWERSDVNYNGIVALRLPQPSGIYTLFDRVQSEISFEWIYFPPFFFTVVLGYVCAYGVTKLLNSSGLSRFFWHPGLAFVALWLLLTSVIGLLFLPP